MHAQDSAAGHGAPPLGFLLPQPILARRMIVRGVLVWLLMRAGAGATLAAMGEPVGFSLGWQAAALLSLAATAAVVIAERRRGVPPLLLANLGTPPAAAACWVAVTLLVMEAGVSWLSR